jgi:hypothetical protein
MKSLIITLLASALTAHALAEEAPKNPCEKPALPNSQASEMVIKYFNKRVGAYKVCIDKFVDEQRAFAKQSTDVTKANQAFDAAEVAQKEYNALVEELNAHKPEEQN